MGIDRASQLIIALYILSCVVSIFAAALYNFSHGLIFGSFETKNIEDFYLGIGLYFLVAMLTAGVLSSQYYLKRRFSLGCVLNTLSNLNRKSNSINQLGDRVLDDGEFFYGSCLSHAGDFFENLLRLAYFSFLMLSLLPTHSPQTLMNLRVFVSLLIVFFISCALFLSFSKFLRFFMVSYEKTMNQFRSTLNSRKKTTSRKDIFSKRYYAQGLRLSFYESMNIYMTSLVNYSPYFVPLLLFGMLVLNGELRLGDYVRIASALTSVLHSSIWLSKNTCSISQIRASWARISRIMC